MYILPNIRASTDAKSAAVTFKNFKHFNLNKA